MGADVAEHPKRAAYITMIERGAAEMAASVRRLQALVRPEEQPSPLGADRPILDVERSTRPTGAESEPEPHSR